MSLYAACQPPGQLVRRYSGSSFQTPCLCAGWPCNLFEVTNTSCFLLTCCHCTQNSIISSQSQLTVTCCDSKIKKYCFHTKWINCLIQQNIKSYDYRYYSTYIYAMWCPQDSVQLVYNSNFTRTYGRYIYIVNGIIDQLIILPIGSMYGIYANIKGVYWWDPGYHI